MKKIVLFLLGMKQKPPPAPKRFVPAHEHALKQLNARRREEKAKAIAASAGEATGASGMLGVPAQATPVAGGAVALIDGATQSPPPQAAAEVPRVATPAVPVAGGAVARSDEGAQSPPPHKDEPQLRLLRVAARIGLGHQIYEPQHQLADISAGIELKWSHPLADAGSIAGENRRGNAARPKLAGRKRKRQR